MKKFQIGDRVLWSFKESGRTISGRVIKNTNDIDPDNKKQYLIKGIISDWEYWVREEDLERDIKGERDDKINQLLG